MKSKFPIYWVDDEPDVIAPKRKRVESYIRSLGFEPNIITVNEISITAVEDIKSLAPYFVITDYNLRPDGQDGGGDELISNLRNADCYHEVIFYTQSGFSSEMKTKLFDTGNMDIGVSFIKKAGSENFIKKIIGQKVSEYADLSTQRGWIVADAILLEARLNSILTELAKALHPSFGGSMMRIVEKNIDFGFRSDIVGGLLKDTIKHLRTTSESEDVINELASCKTVFNKFKDEIIELRNTIAHQRASSTSLVKLKILQKKSPYSDDDKFISFDDNFLSKVRRNFNKHASNMAKIELVIEKLTVQ